jgi:molybdenum cofactor cytidylyltransferase
MSGAAAIVLAAGPSSRLGRPKQLLQWHGRPLLETVVSSAASWPVERVVVVLGAFADEILDSIDFGNATVAINEEWEEGMASSLRVGLDVVGRDSGLDMAFVALGDQPWIPQDVPEGLLDRADESDRLAIVPVYRYLRSNPVLFRRSLWERLMAISGDMGAKQLLKAHPDWVEEVRFDHPPPRDIDTEDDVADLLTPPRRPASGDAPGR